MTFQWMRGVQVAWGPMKIVGGPFPDDTTAIVTSSFGPRDPVLTPQGWTGFIDPVTGLRTDFHYGVDFWPFDHGDGTGCPLLALGYGEVNWVASADIAPQTGNAIEVRYNDGADQWRVQYFHLLQPPAFSPGQRVEPGQILGYVDTTGFANGPHLHLAMYLNDYIQNPMAVLAQFAQPIGFVPLRQLTGQPGHFDADGSGGYTDEYGNYSPGQP